MSDPRMPPLGFPAEMWDDDGDYFCRPLPGYAAAVLWFESRGWNVDIAPAVIQNSINTHAEVTHD